MVERVQFTDTPKDDAAAAQKAHDDAMAAKGGTVTINGQEPAAPKEGDQQVAQRPEGIPEKFWNAEKGEVNVEALLKAQADGEAEIRRLQQPKGDEKKPEGQTGDKPEDKPAEQKQEGVVAAASAEWAEKGELSAETYKSLEGVGLSRDMVDAYIDGQKAIVQSLQTAAFGEFDGTPETYQKAIEWAAQNLNESEIKALDVQLTSTNPEIVKQGAKALAAKYKADADVTPTVNIQGNGGNEASGAMFKSSHEMTTAMRDPRYAKDATYRAEVERKIANGAKAGYNLFG